MEYTPNLQDSGTTAARRIALLNVKYSPNLGDGIIAECLERELSRLRPDWDVTSIDLAGREDFGTGLDSGRGMALRVLEILPGPLRRLATAVVLRALIHLKYRRVWQRASAGTDAAIIGGGQLFADADLNFPIKIAAALGEFQTPETPVAIFGVGVAGRFSRKGRELLVSALEEAPIAHVATRDEGSSDRWDKTFARDGIPVAEVCCDPGLLAADVYPSGQPPNCPLPRIGIGIVNPSTIRLHSSATSKFSRDEALAFWRELSLQVMERGYAVSLFTNGPQDDERFLDEVIAAPGMDQIDRSPKPTVPADLAHTVRGFDAVVAHRLHASILAYSYGIPHLGLGWDPKIKAFFNSVDRSEFALDPAEHSPVSIADLLDYAINTGIDPDRHALTLQNTRSAILSCVDDLDRALANSTPAPRL